MADPNVVEKPLLEKIQDLLERKSEHYDVAFCVGKEKKIVRALKIILKASSPFLEKEFEEKWELAVIKEGKGIPLPDFDPTAFELFVKFTSLDTWSLENLKKLNLLPNNILNLLTICRRFEMRKAVEILEKLATTFMQSFDKYKYTDDFLQLSQTNLKSVLVSDDIGIKELDVFHSAIRWAEFQCEEIKVEPSDERIREVLGDSLFDIRFTIMTNTEFTKASDSKDILTAQVTIGIYKFIGLELYEKLEFDTKKLPFKNTLRKLTQALEAKPNSYTSNSVECGPNFARNFYSFLDSRLTNRRKSSVCLQWQPMLSLAKIKLFGFGFLGPIEKDAFYNVNVQIQGIQGIVYNSGMLGKRIFAQKGKTFYFVFDAPIEFEAGSIRTASLSKKYCIYYTLMGPNTYAVKRTTGKLVLQEGSTKFGFTSQSSQLAEILFKLI